MNVSREQSPSYDDKHRAFLQVLFARGTITYQEAKPIIAEIINAHCR